MVVHMFGTYVQMAEVDCVAWLVKELTTRVSTTEKANSTLTSRYDALAARLPKKKDAEKGSTIITWIFINVEMLTIVWRSEF